MAQASNAQREPSMEEILASIRRIIEDNEPQRKEPDIATIEPAIGPAANDTAPIEASRAESFVRPTIDRTPVERALAATQKKLAEPVSRMDDVKPVRSLAPELPAKDEIIDALAELDQLDGVEIDVEALSAAVAEETKREAETLKYATPEPVSKPEAQVHPQPEQAPVVRGSIISENISRQVASSFGELSDVFASSRQRNIDDVAEDMLRPMLQDWLDNNLPVLVERLVREEIERVARGG